MRNETSEQAWLECELVGPMLGSLNARTPPEYVPQPVMLDINLKLSYSVEA